MLSEMGRRPIISAKEGSFEDDLEEIGLLLREQRRQDSAADDRERELNLYRSGSAPPTVEGSLSAVGGLFGGGGVGRATTFSELFSDEELRSDPAYHAYYYSNVNVNLNPRLPPPFLSKEDWRSAQRLNGVGSSVLGGIGDRRKVVNTEVVSGGGERSSFSMPPGFNSRKERPYVEVVSSNEWGGDGLIGLPGLGLGSKQKSLAEIFQDDMGQTTPVMGLPSRPSSRNAFDDNVEILGPAESELASMRRDLSTPDGLRSSSNSPPSSYTYAAALGASLSRGNTPDPQHIARIPSPCPTPIGGGRVAKSEKRGVSSPNSFNVVSSTGINGSADLAAALSSMSLSSNVLIDNEIHLQSQLEQDINNRQSYLFSQKNTFMKKPESVHLGNNMNGSEPDLTNSSVDRHSEMQHQKSSTNSFLKGSPTSTLISSAQYQHIDGTNSSYLNHGFSGYSVNPTLASMMTGQLGSGNLPPLFENVATASALGAPGLDSHLLGGLASASESHNLGRMGSHIAQTAPFVDPMYLQYLRTSEYAAAQLAAPNGPSMDRSYGGNSYLNMIELQKAYLGALLSPQKSQYNKSGGSNNHGYYGNASFGVGLSYPGSPMASPVLSNASIGSGSPIRQSFPSGMRNLVGGMMGSWHLDGGMEEGFPSSLLEEFKSNKTKCFELSEIAGHVVEFSADQYGSRFIQQKLETATTEEKNIVYKEIMPQALALMTDVFGNYVIQKFFEHGLSSQRRELANKLFGHVLTLSLQMYGCRVIQKAIEVVDIDQKIKIVEELDGHVMRCVRDQNGNHVIQKSIECVPEEAIQFIVTTFYDQVVTLSAHPYGCRVIQRVLEHCNNPNTQSKIMDEILGAVSMLAQDQYGNYVVQHVLEHGKAHERSTIIKELAGKIVQMSQQKFASNVVEKCLAFGGVSERQLLVTEMLGTTDENEPLQAMMKDQFANYVVQKVLETCDDQQRELILSRIKIHLNALKKYTYGKHIVVRVEKLVAAGERRIAAQSSMHTA